MNRKQPNGKWEITETHNSLVDPKQFLADFEYQFKKGQAMYWMKISLQRPLSSEELARYKELCKEIGIEV